MKPQPFTAMKLHVLPFLAAALATAGPAMADSTYTYTLNGTNATITGFVATTGPAGAVTVPATVDGYVVKALDRNAFRNRTGITSVAFASGNSVTSIGPTAFEGCTALVSATLPTGVTAISAGLFGNCGNLTTVTLPGGASSVGAAAFAGCGSLGSLSLPTGLLSIGESAFLDCVSLTSLTVPSGVTTISAQMCDGCVSLSSLTLPAGVSSIGALAFHDCDSLVSLSLPASLASLGRDAFRSCDLLGSITLGSAVATIGDGVFDDCPALTTIAVNAANPAFASVDGVLFDKSLSTLLRMPEGRAGAYAIPSSVTTVATAALSHASLASVSLPASLGSVAQDAFYYATGLTEIEFPASVSTIGSWAFGGCVGLTSVAIPSTVSAISDDAFHGSAGLEWAWFQGASPTMGAEVFDGAASGFIIYFHEGQPSYTTPTWLGYPAVALASSPSLIGWLIDNGFSPADTGTSDPNHDGVSLLAAYALGLDPNANLAGSMPVPVMTESGLQLTFQGNSDGVTYSAEGSENLDTWSGEGIVLSEPDGSGIRTALVPSGDPRCFLRLVFED